MRKIVIGLLVLFYSMSISMAQNFEKDKKPKEDKPKKEEKEEKEEKDNFKFQEVDYNLIQESDSYDTYYFTFSNIGHEEFFYDPHLLMDIDKYTRMGDEQKTIEYLELYIAHFGIQNFSRDTDLLWKLAQLYEKNGRIEEAKSAYRLVLKHYPVNNYESVKNYTTVLRDYEKSTALEKDEYVPLDYYYRLVDYRKQIDTLIPPKSVLLNMGSTINLPLTAEYGPSINDSDDLILYTRKVKDKAHLNHEGVPAYTENLFISYKDVFSGWSKAEELPMPIMSSCNEGSAAMSSDGMFLVFSRCLVNNCNLDCYDCMGSCDLFYSKFDLIKEEWTKPVNFGKKVNSTGWDSQPSFSITGDTIFFASDRVGGFGLSDIYFTYKTGEDTWSKAENMGPIINTRGNEWSPFHSKMHPVFYFSSNAQLVNFDASRISNDLFKSNYKDGRWQEPKNLGPLVNGGGDETYFSIDAQNKHLYYARTEENSTSKAITDIYSFPVPMEAQPLATTVLKGKLLDKDSGKPYKGIVSVIDLENGIEVAPKFMREDGTYQFDLINHNKYLLVIQGDDFFRIEELFELDGDTTIESTATSISQKTLQFTSIIFENGKADILPEMHKDLNNIVNFMVDNPEFNLNIGGHTDSDGNQEANKKLSQKRADAIKKYLIDKGFIDGSRIEAVGYGSSHPIRTPELTEEDKSINRRVEFEISKVEN